MTDKKYYWLKLKKDFFKRHDIRIIEAMPNGKDYILFYLKLLLESIDHEGSLRFNDTIPYNEQMLSVVTNTNADIVKSAMEMFRHLEMVDVFDDSTIYMTEVDRMIGSATDNDNANRQRRFRDSQKQLPLQNVTESVTKNNESKRKSLEKDTDKDIKPLKRFTKPTFEDVQAYCQERKNNVDAKAFFDYYETGDWKDAKGKPVRNWKQKVITWERSDSSGTSKGNETNKGKFARTFDYDRFTD